MDVLLAQTNQFLKVVVGLGVNGLDGDFPGAGFDGAAGLGLLGFQPLQKLLGKEHHFVFQGAFLGAVAQAGIGEFELIVIEGDGGNGAFEDAFFPVFNDVKGLIGRNLVFQ
mgnify:FL=1